VSFVLLSLAEVSFSVITTGENPVGLSFVVEALSGTEESKQRNRKKNAETEETRELTRRRNHMNLKQRNEEF
jgi:hypothetical protein